MNCPSVCLATCPAWSTDCSCSIFGLQHASLFAQKLKVKWLADTRSPFCYCMLHTHFLYRNSCKLGSVLLPAATSRGREGGFLGFPNYRKVGFVQANGSRCLVSAHCNHFRLWSLILNIFFNYTAFFDDCWV